MFKPGERVTITVVVLRVDGERVDAQAIDGQLIQTHVGNCRPFEHKSVRPDENKGVKPNLQRK